MGQKRGQNRIRGGVTCDEKEKAEEWERNRPLPPHRRRRRLGAEPREREFFQARRRPTAIVGPSNNPNFRAGPELN